MAKRNTKAVEANQPVAPVEEVLETTGEAAEQETASVGKEAEENVEKTVSETAAAEETTEQETASVGKEAEENVEEPFAEEVVEAKEEAKTPVSSFGSDPFLDNFYKRRIF